MADAPIPIGRARSAPSRQAVDLVIHGIGTMVTPAGAEPPLRGDLLGRVITVSGAAIAVRNGMIVEAGPELQVRAAVEVDSRTHLLDARGMLAIPGFVDCHAHPLFAGDRAAEFELRSRGADYRDILAAGGGIGSTIAQTDAAPDAELRAQVDMHLDWMLRAGTTTTEMKSGYASGIAQELRLLGIGMQAAAGHPIDTSLTCLAAHAVPAGFEGDADAWIDEVAIPTLGQAASEGRAAQADVFLEEGTFDASQARRYLEAAAALGLGLRLHADQFTRQGGIELAIELGARSVDHLEATDADGISRLAASRVAAVLLPTSAHFLGRPAPPGRQLIDAGAVVALASDFNPGSSFAESLPLAMHLAAVGSGMTAAESLSAATINGAWVLGLHRVAGRIQQGYRADIVLCDQPDLRHLAYHAGTPGIEGVVKHGLPVVGIDAPADDAPPPPEAAF